MAYNIKNKDHVFENQGKQRTMEEVCQIIDKNFGSEELKDAAKKIVDMFSQAPDLNRYVKLVINNLLVGDKLENPKHFFETVKIQTRNYENSNLGNAYQDKTTLKKMFTIAENAVNIINNSKKEAHKDADVKTININDLSQKEQEKNLFQIFLCSWKMVYGKLEKLPIHVTKK